MVYERVLVIVGWLNWTMS